MGTGLSLVARFLMGQGGSHKVYPLQGLAARLAESGLDAYVAVGKVMGLEHVAQWGLLALLVYSGCGKQVQQVVVGAASTCLATLICVVSWVVIADGVCARLIVSCVLAVWVVVLVHLRDASSTSRYALILMLAVGAPAMIKVARSCVKGVSTRAITVEGLVSPRHCLVDVRGLDGLRVYPPSYPWIRRRKD